MALLLPLRGWHRRVRVEARLPLSDEDAIGAAAPGASSSAALS